MKTKFKICIIILFLTVFLLFFWGVKNKYDLKIEIETQYQNIIKLDETLAKNVEKELLKMQEIKDIVIFSSKNGCKIYCKFSLLQKYSKTLGKIQRALTSILREYDCIKLIQYSENYSKKYPYFVVISNKNNYYDLKKHSDFVLDKLLNLKISSDIKVFGLQQKANYIYFSNNDLLNFDLDVNELCELIKNNHIGINYFQNININGTFNNIDDIKNLTIPYKNQNFSLKFSDIFQIEEKIKISKKEEVFYGDKNAIIFAISPKNIFSFLFLKNKLKDFDVEVFSLNSFKNVEIYLSQNLDIESSSKKYKEIISNLNSFSTLGFIGVLPFNYKSNFDEIYENRIIIFYPKSIHNKLVNVLKNQKLNYFFNNRIVFSHKQNKTDFIVNPSVQTEINYKINEYTLNDYGLNKSDIINSFLAQKEGLICTTYWQKDDKVEVILKNLDNDDYFYSKKYKNLISSKSIFEYNLASNYTSIARKNGKILYIKKPKTHL